jgi:drug/metabolite transporter (DMT)-like permease
MSIGIALLSGFLHATWNTLAKTKGREREATVVTLTWGLASALLTLLFVGPHRAPQSSWVWLLLAGLGELGYVISLGKAYATGSLSLTYAVSRATALIAIWPLSFLFFDSTPTLTQGLATGTCMAGIVLCRGRDGELKLNIPLTLATGVCVALYHSGYKGAVSQGATPVLSFVVAVTLALPLLWISLGSKIYTAGAMLALPRFIFAGILSAASFILLIVGLEFTASGPMLALRNASVGFALFMAAALGERLSIRQWAGLGVLAIGIALFALA